MARKRRKKHRAPESGPNERSPQAPERINRPFAEALAHLRPAPQDGVGAPAAGDRIKEGKPRTVERAPKAARKADTEPAPRPAPEPAPKREPALGRDDSPAPRPPDYAYEDRVAFQQAYAGVRPLGRRRSEPIGDPVIAPGSGRSGGTPTATSATRTPAERAGDAQARARLAALVGGGVSFELERDPDGRIEALRQGAHPSNLRSLLDRGVAPEATLDLHGESEGQAQSRVTRFVRDRHRRGDRVLRIVHGKGRHSPGGAGVLADAVKRALTDGGAAPLVAAFASAPARLGGTGAVVVRLVPR